MTLRATLCTALILGLSACGPGEDHDPPVTASTKLRALYVNTCAACHQHEDHPVKGAGGLHHGAPTFIGAKWMSTRSDASLVETILKGRPGTAMPAHTFLSRAEAQEMAQGLLRPLSQRKSSRDHAFWEKTQGVSQCSDRCL